MNRLTWLLLSAILMGCSGGGGGSGPSCQGMAGAEPSSSGTGCTDCTVEDEGLASDGDGDTYAAMTVPAASTGTIAVRATAGEAFPDGAQPSVIFSATESANQSSPTWTINTYLNGVLQQSSQATQDGIGSHAREKRRYEFSATTTLPFDAVELSFTRTAGANEEITRVHEICVDP